MRKENERRIKETERLMIDSDSTSEEEICQEEMSRMTLDRMTENRDYYSNTAIIQSGVCETIQISGRIHVHHLPCDDHHDDQTDDEYDDDPYTQE